MSCTKLPLFPKKEPNGKKSLRGYCMVVGVIVALKGGMPVSFPSVCGLVLTLISYAHALP